ncbi:class I SAM-dependent DNA methyltransferase [Alkaliphilus oremlandii]|uniref:Methyltransferase type 11 n=1 Tax=Alkaliphilus oremlandii (strain OhILAs) TaxID=350688 RepID=A8MIB1_ALKOO|nr:class I SAM-dependent methyltransferase [Alkaliphilus oremlandii]ABW19543.1 Methyltransferase type 11 [Alkaliphilus oremlandii OhILAs]
MTEQYGGFAYIYDRLMEDVDYGAWANYVEELMTNDNRKPKKILELACGTGNITIPLANKGYRLTGVDISEDMLMVAKNKAIDSNQNVLFIQQDMVELEFDEKFDCVLAMCDGINYITEEIDLDKVFHNVYEVLEKDGLFIFDISSYYKLKHILGDNTFGENLEDLCYLWENYFNEDERIIEMNLTFFIQEGSLYRKEEEYHIQRAYEIDEIMNLLNRNFKEIRVLDGFSLDAPKNNSERVFFIAKKSE